MVSINSKSNEAKVNMPLCVIRIFSLLPISHDISAHSRVKIRNTLFALPHLALIGHSFSRGFDALLKEFCSVLYNNFMSDAIFVNVQDFARMLYCILAMEMHAI